MDRDPVSYLDCKTQSSACWSTGPADLTVSRSFDSQENIKCPLFHLICTISEWFRVLGMTCLRWRLLSYVVLLSIIPGSASASVIVAWSKPVVAPIFKTWRPNNARSCFQHETAREAAYCHFYVETGYIYNSNREGPPFYVDSGARGGERWGITDTRTGKPANTQWIRKFYTCPEGSRPASWWSPGATWRVYRNSLFDPASQFDFCVVEQLHDPQKNLGCSNVSGQESGQVGNPCNAAIGNKVQAEVDYVVDGNEALTIRRYYNSQAKERANTPFMGKKWRLSLMTRAHLTSTGSVASLRVQRPNGQVLTFTQLSGNSYWTSHSDVNESMHLENGQWMLELPSGTVEKYGSSGLLQEKENHSGVVTSYVYDGEDKLIEIIDSFGRRLQFSYSEDNYIQGITTPDNKMITYKYQGDHSSALRLVGVAYPDGSTRVYHYEDPDFPHHLTGITDENGDRFATFSYDAQGRVVKTEHAQTENTTSQERFTLEYQW